MILFHKNRITCRHGHVPHKVVLFSVPFVTFYSIHLSLTLCNSYVIIMIPLPPQKYISRNNYCLQLLREIGLKSSWQSWHYCCTELILDYSVLCKICLFAVFIALYELVIWWKASTDIEFDLILNKFLFYSCMLIYKEYVVRKLFLLHHFFDYCNFWMG